MKIPVLFVMTTFLAISISELNRKLMPVEVDCNDIVIPVEYYSQTVFFDMDVHSQPEIKTCILKNSLSNLSRIIISVYATKIDIRVNVTRNFIKTSDNPNVIVMTKYLTPTMIDSSIWKFFFRSRWSVLFIVITGDKFKCENGTMDTRNLSLLERMMNVLWHRFQIMRVAILFPFACEQKVLLYHGKRPSSKGLYDRSVKLYNNSNYHNTYLAIKQSGEKLADDYPMRGSIFYRYPTSIKDCKNMRYYDSCYNLKLTGGYCGVDGMVMHDILSHLKFNLTMPENENCDNYGTVGSDGHGVGGNSLHPMGHCAGKQNVDRFRDGDILEIFVHQRIVNYDWLFADEYKIFSDDKKRVSNGINSDISSISSTLMHRRDLVTIDRKSDAFMQIMQNYTDRFGTPMIDIVDECFYTYYLSYVARSDFPFFEDVQYFTERLQEAGLPTMYYKWTQQMLDIPRLVTDDNRSLPRPLFKIRLRDQCVAFTILFIGSLCSLAIFAAEIWKGKRQNEESRVVKINLK
ncbi:unnamed protein product [Spodoptera littoralis]|uniref:Uncharacterized protein n=1 Tax=Spodoptera littoralis TaxID=7109 RepID=A0A9P0I5J8_SPOLI|nr:unnamed protein product [Spodoptera littoralis]CAH1640292.1 unnamed protein product [Spodoptera littoralis]